MSTTQNSIETLDKCIDTEPSSPTFSHLLKSTKRKQQRNKVSQSDSDRPDFCCNIQNPTYTLMRVYMDSSEKHIKLYYTKLTPRIRKEGQVCIVHGYGGSSDQFLQLAEALAKEGFVVNMIDLRGFGYSGGERNHRPVKGILSDIETLLKSCCQIGLPTFMMAHGLGAMFTLAVLEENPRLPLSGVVLLSPLLTFPSLNGNSLIYKLILRFSPSVLDSLQLASPINPTSLTKKPEAIQKKIQNYFRYQELTMRMAFEFDRLGQKVKEEAYKFRYPLLVCRGGKDIVQSESQLEKFMSQISSSAKTMKIFSEGLHELHNDYQADQLKDELIKWLSHMKEKTSIKWKRVKGLNLDHVLKRHFFSKIVFLMISILLSLLAFLRKGKLFPFTK